MSDYGKIVQRLGSIIESRADNVDGERLAADLLAELLEPTPEMVQAGYDAAEDDWIGGDNLGWDQIPITYRAMIARALTA